MSYIWVAVLLHAVIAGLGVGGDTRSGTTGVSKEELVQEVMAEILRQAPRSQGSGLQASLLDTGSVNDSSTLEGSPTPRHRLTVRLPEGGKVLDVKGKGAKGKGGKGGKGRDGKGKDDKGKGAKGKGGKGHDAQGVERKRKAEGGSQASYGKVNWLSEDTFRLGSNDSTMAFHVPTLVRLLVDRYEVDERRARQMCFPVGVDFYHESSGQSKNCTEPELHAGRPWAHDFPKGFPKAARTAMQQYWGAGQDGKQ